MTHADGNIIIKARVDVSQAEKSLGKLREKIEETEDAIAGKEAEKSALLEEAERLQQSMKNARQEAEKFGKEWASGVVGADRDQTRALETLREVEGQYADVVKNIDQIDKKLMPAYEKLDAMQEEAGELAKKINSTSKASLRMGEAQERAEKSLRKFGLRLREVIRSALVFTLISQTLAKFREWMGEVIKTNSEATAAIAKLKGALLTMAQPLVEKIVPALADVVNFLAQMVTYIAQLVAILFGTTAEKAADAAGKLFDEQNAIEEVGDAAKKAAKHLASFDEINQLTGDSASFATDTIAPDFSGLAFFELPEWLTSLTVTMSDILFKWEDLTTEDVLEKVVASLTTLAGSVIGFSLGGVGGAVIGMTLGASLGAWLSDLTFDKNNELDTEEILKSLCTALTATAGAVLGFEIGGAKGAAIGVTVGAGVAAGITSLLFDNDGEMSKEELVSSLCAALFAVTGGVLGFKAGGIKGATLGVMVGAGVGAIISKLVFDNDGVITPEEIVKSVCVALGSLVGGIIGFSVGGPGGAVMGVMIGSAATAALSGLVFDNDGRIDQRELLVGLCAVLGTLVGGIIGFSVGGPLGAAIGMTIGAVVTITLTDLLFEGFGTLKEKVPNFTGIGPDYSWLFKNATAQGLSVPGLASGSVVPPNRKFLAVLGDNTSETEVVSPLSTMKQAMIEAMRESGTSGGKATTIVLDGELAALARVLRPYILDEGRRVGVNLVTR